MIKVLLLAEACNPEWTSVPLVGYNIVRALAERPDLDVTLVTHVRNQSALEKDEISNLCRLEFINNEMIAKPLYTLGKLLRGGGSLGWTTNMAVNWPAYVCFEKMVYRRFRQELNDGDFDVIHRVTPVSPTMPSPLATLSDVPMMIGPLNGGLPWPELYPELRKKEREWLVPIRNAYKHLPYYRSSYRRLAGLVAGSKHTASEAPGCFGGRHFYQPENGIDPKRFKLADSWTAPQGRFRFAAVGRLVPYKGFHLTLQAMANSPILRQCEFTIIGDGPERERLEQQAADAGLQDNVNFEGWLPQTELSAVLRDSQVFAFPSLREFGGGVVLEAMASGLPSVIVDYGGPAELVTPDTGIAIPMQPEAELVESLQVAMESLAIDSELCSRMADAALHRVRTEFTWVAKARQTEEFYRELIDQPAASAVESAIDAQDEAIDESADEVEPGTDKYQGSEVSV